MHTNAIAKKPKTHRGRRELGAMPGMTKKSVFVFMGFSSPLRDRRVVI
jgi:hypothetical protein